MAQSECRRHVLPAISIAVGAEDDGLMVGGRFGPQHTVQPRAAAVVSLLHVTIVPTPGTATSSGPAVPQNFCSPIANASKSQLGCGSTSNAVLYNTPVVAITSISQAA